MEEVVLFYHFTKRVTKQTVIIIVGYYCYQLHTNVINCPPLKVIIGDHQCGFRRNRSTTDQIFCICQILEKKWEYNETLHQLFIDFKETYDLVRREVLYPIFVIVFLSLT
jgi:hypothetical protein